MRNLERIHSTLNAQSAKIMIRSGFRTPVGRNFV